MTELGERLLALELPDSEIAMKVAARVIAADATEPASARWRRVRSWLGSIGLGLLIGFAFTQPGRAVTGDLGRLVGIGDEPTVRDYGEVKVKSLVIGTAHTPTGSEVNIVASRPVKPKRGDLCFSLDIPLTRAAFGPCFTGSSFATAQATGVAPAGISLTPPEFAPAGTLVLSGVVRSDVSSVTVSYLDADGERQTVPVDFAALSEEQAQALGASHPGSA
jgi:hypothetical protein